MKNLKIKLASVFFVLLSLALYGNDIRVTEVGLTDQDEDGGFTFVQFNLSWQNSWRYDTGPANWDAAWVFVKVRISGGEWQHARLHHTGHDVGGQALELGLLDPFSAHHADDNPVMGVFIYREEVGAGTFSVSDILLRWNYSLNGIDDDDVVDVRVFAIEMVYVPQGGFFLGSGGQESNRFYEYGQLDIVPFWVTGDWDRVIGTSDGNLYATGQRQAGTLNEGFPTGYQPFYMMKYQVSQQQYVDFLNTLTPMQADNRAYTSGGSRHAITSALGTYSTNHPDVACNFINWMDAAAFADWAGLRPMTELEYEKASRRPLNPQRNAFAWDNVSITPATGIDEGGTADEVATPETANAVFGNQTGGPLRVGNFAREGTNRTQSGGSYWGAMEMSGNLWEQVVSVVNATGLAFSGLHGDGSLNPTGNATIENWPGYSGGQVTTATGSGLRGGGWDADQDRLRVSDRGSISSTGSSRIRSYGFRAVRSVAPAGD